MVFIFKPTSKLLFYKTLISYLVFKIHVHTFKMGCRIKKNDWQDCLKLKQFVKKSLYCDMDIVLEFSNMTMFKIR